MRETRRHREPVAEALAREAAGVTIGRKLRRAAKAETRRMARERAAEMKRKAKA